MKIASILENQKIEKRIAITPEIAKKYISLGFEVSLSENYGSHLGIKDEEYKELGVSILKDEKEIITSSDIIVQLGLLDDDKSSLLKEHKTFIGVLNPYDNKDKINDLVKKNINTFSLELLPRITRAQSMDILSSQANLAGYKAVVESFAKFEKAIPMMMTAAGTIPAAKVLVVGYNTLGQEIIKNLVLQGISQIDIYFKNKLENYQKTGLYYPLNSFNVPLEEFRKLNPTIQIGDVVEVSYPSNGLYSSEDSSAPLGSAANKFIVLSINSAYDKDSPPTTSIACRSIYI